MDSQVNTPIPIANTIPNTDKKNAPNTTLNNDPPFPKNTAPASKNDTSAPNKDTVIIQDDTDPTQLKSPKKEVTDEPHTAKRKPTRTSDIWDHFTKIKGGNPMDPRCTCNYCGANYACHSRRIGTSSLWVHFHKCKKNPYRAAATTDKKQKVLSFHKAADGGADANDPLLSLMAVSMKEKYDKYWGNADCINPLLFLAVVLDPRYKMKYLRYCFESVYDSETVARVTVKVESILQRLYACYSAGIDGTDNKDVRADFLPKTAAFKESRRRRMLENYLQLQQMETTESKNDVDRYLSEEPLNPMTASFDILLWWKDNSSRYATLSLIARDVLAIPVSTVASESAFSTSGRILDPFRSSLSPKMLEVLVCTQSWLKGRNDGIKSKDFLDDIHSYAFLEEGNIDKGKETSAGATVDIDD